MPVASFYFWQNNVRTEFFQYEISQGQDGDIWNFDLRQIISGVNVPEDVYPLAWSMSYDFVNNTVTANCASSPTTPTNATTPCMTGSFTQGSLLSLSIDDTRTNTTTNLRAVNTPWSFYDASPSYILREVNSDGSLGDIAVMTLVTKYSTCTLLQLCVASETGLDALAALGLTLLSQNDFALQCTTPASNNN